MLRRGRIGALRLQVLSQAAAPATLSLLDRLPWESHWRSLDVGCGLGSVTRELACRGAGAVGLDHCLDYTEGPAEFLQGDARRLDLLEEHFHVVYARYLLSHLSDPQQVVNGMVNRLCPGGYLVLEDIDFPGHTCHPPCAAFQAYVELYTELVGRRGGNACLGRSLWSLCRKAGLEVVYSGASVRLFRAGPEKRVAELTLAHIARGLVEEGLVARGRLAMLLRELRDFRRGESQMCLAPTYQVVARFH